MYIIDTSCNVNMKKSTIWILIQLSEQMICEKYNDFLLTNSLSKW